MTPGIHRALRELYLQRGEGVVSPYNVEFAIANSNDVASIYDEAFRLGASPTDEQVSITDEAIAIRSGRIVSEDNILVLDSAFASTGINPDALPDIPKVGIGDEASVNPIHSHIFTESEGWESWNDVDPPPGRTGVGYIAIPIYNPTNRMWGQVDVDDLGGDGDHHVNSLSIDVVSTNMTITAGLTGGLDDVESNVFDLHKIPIIDIVDDGIFGATGISVRYRSVTEVGVSKSRFDISLDLSELPISPVSSTDFIIITQTSDSDKGKRVAVSSIVQSFDPSTTTINVDTNDYFVVELDDVYYRKDTYDTIRDVLRNIPGSTGHFLRRTSTGLDWAVVSGGTGGSSTFIGLSDTEDSYSITRTVTTPGRQFGSFSINVASRPTTTGQEFVRDQPTLPNDFFRLGNGVADVAISNVNGIVLYNLQDNSSLFTSDIGGTGGSATHLASITVSSRAGTEYTASSLRVSVTAGGRFLQIDQQSGTWRISSELRDISAANYPVTISVNVTTAPTTGQVTERRIGWAAVINSAGTGLTFKDITTPDIDEESVYDIIKNIFIGGRNTGITLNDINNTITITSSAAPSTYIERISVTGNRLSWTSVGGDSGSFTGSGGTATTGITSISTGTGLDSSVTGGAASITLDLSEFATATPVATDYFIFLDGGANGVERKAALSSIPGLGSGDTTISEYIESVSASGNTLSWTSVGGTSGSFTPTTAGGGGITGIIVGLGLDVSVANSVATITPDLSEFSSATPLSTDYFIFLSGTAQNERKALISSIPGLGTGTGTAGVSSITVGTGLDASASTGVVSITMDLSEFQSATPVSTDYFVFLDGGATGLQRKAAISTLRNLIGGGTSTGVDTFLKLTDTPNNWPNLVTYTSYGSINIRLAEKNYNISSRYPGYWRWTWTGSLPTVFQFTSIIQVVSDSRLRDLHFVVRTGNDRLSDAILPVGMYAVLRVGSNTYQSTGLLSNNSDGFGGDISRSAGAWIWNFIIPINTVNTIPVGGVISIEFRSPVTPSQNTKVAAWNPAINASAITWLDAPTGLTPYPSVPRDIAFTGSVGTSPLFSRGDHVHGGYNPSGGGGGDNQTIVAGTGLSGGGSGNTVTLNSDFSEFQIATPVATDYFIFLDGGADGIERKASLSMIPGLGGSGTGTDTNTTYRLTWDEDERELTLVGSDASESSVTISGGGGGGGTGDITAVNTKTSSGLSGGKASGSVDLLLDVDNLLTDNDIHLDDYIAYSNQDLTGDPTRRTTFRTVLNLFRGSL